VGGFLLIGPLGAGQGALVRALADPAFISRRFMAVEHCGPFIVTPGEFLENRRFHRILITSAMSCDAVLLLQNAVHASSLFPPLFAAMFNRTVLGLVTGASADGADAERAGRLLGYAGVREILRVDMDTGGGVEALRQRLASAGK